MKLYLKSFVVLTFSFICSNNLFAQTNKHPLLEIINSKMDIQKRVQKIDNLVATTENNVTKNDSTSLSPETPSNKTVIKTVYDGSKNLNETRTLKYAGEETWLEIGDHNKIREHCSLHRGTVQDHGITKIGSHNLLMVNTHIAHDCVVGDHNIFANNVGVAGHVHVGDYVIVGGNSGIHQFCKIDSYSMIGGASLIVKDVPAYVMVSGNPAHAFAMNVEGMRRKGWSKNVIQGLRTAFKLIYKEGLTTEQALERIRAEILPEVAEVQLLIDSLEQSERGIVR